MGKEGSYKPLTVTNMRCLNTLLLPALIGLATACQKKVEVVPISTPFDFTVTFQQTGLPVDSAIVEILGTTGGVLNPPRTTNLLFRGYTDSKGHISGRIDVVSDNWAHFNCYKLIRQNVRLLNYSMAMTYPYTNTIKKGEDNKIRAELDTLR
jgi:hypothetical protein